MNTFIGIDPGLDGGIFYLSEDPLCYKMPTKKVNKSTREVNVIWLHTLLIHLIDQETKVFVERINGPVPRSSLQSAFKFGKTYQSVIACLDIIGMPYELVDATKWKAVVLRGTDHSKQAAIEWASRMYPKLDLGTHDGLCDAACIAEYGRRLTMGTP